MRLGEGPIFSEVDRCIQIGRFGGIEKDGPGFRVLGVVWPEVMRLIGVTSATLPGHDPPVAWRAEADLSFYGFPIICCPAYLLDGEMHIGQAPDGIPVLDSQPGRR